MKRKHIIIVVLLLLSGTFAFQSCKEDLGPEPIIYKAAVPANPTPAVDAVVALSGSQYTLTWEGTTTGTWDVYVGTEEPPALVAEGVSGNSYTYTTTTGGHFFWRVITKDQNGIVSTGPIWSFFINSAPSIPELLSPANDSVGFPVSSPLEWDATDAEGDDLTFDLYVGTTNPPELVATDLTGYSAVGPLEASTLYYWKVVAKDSHGATTSSIVQKFTTGEEAIMTFTGDYLCDEPAESYSYDVSFTKASSTSIQTENYWNSGWTAVFELDLVNLTYVMPQTDFTAVWSANEAGIIDPATGTITGTYTIFQNGVPVEQGVHTYTKK
jgi:hypothetical protein